MRRLRALHLVAAMLAAFALSGVLMADLIVRVRNKDGAVVATVSVPGGGSAEVAQTPTYPPSPLPTPLPLPPQPAPVPPDQPPAPAVKALHLIVIRDDAADRTTPLQKATIRGPQFQAAVKAKGLNYHEYDVSGVAVQKMPPEGFNYVAFLNDPKLGLVAPCVLWLDKDGHLARGVKLPADTAAILALVQ